MILLQGRSGWFDSAAPAASLTTQWYDGTGRILGQKKMERCRDGEMESDGRKERKETEGDGRRRKPIRRTVDE